MKNPWDENQYIWVFCIVPHALKLSQKHLLDERYKLECGNLWQQKHLYSLLKWQVMEKTYNMLINYLLIIKYTAVGKVG